MNRNMQRMQEIKPFISVLLLVSTLFGLVLLKMEVRRIGYSVLKSTQEYRKMKDQYRLMTMEYARLTRPDAVHKYAVKRLNFNDARDGQIIQLTGMKLAIPQ